MNYKLMTCNYCTSLYSRIKNTPKSAEKLQCLYGGECKNDTYKLKSCSKCKFEIIEELIQKMNKN